MDKSKIKSIITGQPEQGVPGLQNDWWTFIAPDIWNSHGSFIHDTSGTDYLDMCGFLSTAPVRFDHPRLRDDSLILHFGRIAMYRPSLSDFWTEEMAEFVQTFRTHATPPYMHHYFFIDGGALAVENALKAAFDWKVRLNIQKGLISHDPQEELTPLGTKVLYFENGFHGRSGYTLSLTHTHDPNKYKYYPKFEWYKIDPPVLRFDFTGEIQNRDEVLRKEKEALAGVRKILESKSDDIAAIIVEPVQCEGGDRHIPESFFVSLRKLADTFDVILIYDEVQTGFGTTSKMWAHEHFGKEAVPDVIVFSKKSQVGGIMANFERFSKVKDNVFGKGAPSKSRINSTWGGNLVDMMRCTFFLQIINEEKLLDNAARAGEILLEGLRHLCRRHADHIENPRGRGCLLAIDARTPELKTNLWKKFYDEHFLCLTCGSRTLRFRPHLDVTESEIGLALETMERVLKKL